MLTEAQEVRDHEQFSEEFNNALAALAVDKLECRASFLQDM